MPPAYYQYAMSARRTRCVWEHGCQQRYRSMGAEHVAEVQIDDFEFVAFIDTLVTGINRSSQLLSKCIV